MIYIAIVSFALGIVFEKYFAFGWSAVILVFLLALVLFAYLRQEEAKVGKIIFAIGLAFALGALRMSIVDVVPDPDLYKLVGQKVSFEAVVSDEPDVRDIYTRYTVRPENSKSSVLITADRFPEFVYGDEIKVSGELRLPENFESETGIEFDYVSYLAKDRIHFMIYRPHIEKTGEGQGRWPVSSLYRLKNLFIEKISEAVPEPASALLSGMIFGAKQSLGAELLDDFKKVGLIHIIVLSGYNITVIAAGIFGLTNYFGKRNWGLIASAVAIALFSVMVGLGATVVRACIMALIAILARFLGRPAFACRWLFIAGFLMLLWNPLILFHDPSFQLSFAATLGLILFSPFIFSYLSNFKFRRFIPERFGLREIIASTLAVQFFVLPLLVRMSGSVSIVSFIVNPLLLPLVPTAMAAGALSGAVGLLPLIGGVVAWPFGAVSYFIAQTMISVTQFFASLPLSAFAVGAVSLPAIAIWYSIYAVVFWKLKSKTVSSASTLYS